MLTEFPHGTELKDGWVFDTEILHTDDGVPQPRQSIFLENADDDFFLRDGEIPRYIMKLQAELQSLRAKVQRLEQIEKAAKSCFGEDAIVVSFADMATMSFEESNHVTCQVCGAEWREGEPSQHKDTCSAILLDAVLQAERE